MSIVGWSAVSPFGTGRASFADGVGQARATSAVIDRDHWQVPDGRACLVPDFDVRAVLGKKGTRTMNRMTGLAVTTSGNLLKELGEPLGAQDTFGLVLGTTLGSAQSAIDLTRSGLTGDKPFHIESGAIPYAVMNGAAGQCAIWHGLKGPNATVAAGRSSGLLALNYARRLLLTERAASVLCGAAEEYSAARSWISHHSRDTGTDEQVLGEGCAMFALTTQPAVEPLAELLTIRTEIHSGPDWSRSVRRCVEKALATAHLDASQVWVVSPSGGDTPAAADEIRVLRELFGEDSVLDPVTDLVGETHAVSASFQLAGVLSLAGQDPAAAGRIALVSSVDPVGSVAVAVLRLGAAA
ncbi:3-oxoacyl-ACP synthase [Kineosporia sp. NBRC 101731]|nr:3-oxoacyl-ACP synthase [Kineosporia sp. NBRC 101731]